MAGRVFVCLLGLLVRIEAQTQLTSQPTFRVDMYTALVPVNIRCVNDPSRDLSCTASYPENCKEKWDFPNPCTRRPAVGTSIMKYVHPFDTGKFLVCGVHGRLFVEQCPQQQVFHEGCGDCVHDYTILTSNCRNMTVSPDYIENPCTKDNILADKLFFPFPKNISRYIHCDIWGKAWERECTRGEVWSEFDVACVDPNLMNPCGNPIADITHMYSHPCDPLKYVRCDVERNAYEVNCPTGEAYHEINQKCEAIQTFYRPIENICHGLTFTFRHSSTLPHNISLILAQYKASQQLGTANQFGTLNIHTGGSASLQSGTANQFGTLDKAIHQSGTANQFGTLDKAIHQSGTANQFGTLDKAIHQSGTANQFGTLDIHTGGSAAAQNEMVMEVIADVLESQASRATHGFGSAAGSSGTGAHGFGSAAGSSGTGAHGLGTVAGSSGTGTHGLGTVAGSSGTGTHGFGPVAGSSGTGTHGFDKIVVSSNTATDAFGTVAGSSGTGAHGLGTVVGSSGTGAHGLGTVAGSSNTGTHGFGTVAAASDVFLGGSSSSAIDHNTAELGGTRGIGHQSAGFETSPQSRISSTFEAPPPSAVSAHFDVHTRTVDPGPMTIQDQGGFEANQHANVAVSGVQDFGQTGEPFGSSSQASVANIVLGKASAVLSGTPSRPADGGAFAATKHVNVISSGTQDFGPREQSFGVGENTVSGHIFDKASAVLSGTPSGVGGGSVFAASKHANTIGGTAQEFGRTDQSFGASDRAASTHGFDQTSSGAIGFDAASSGHANTAMPSAIDSRSASLIIQRRPAQTSQFTTGATGGSTFSQTATQQHDLSQQSMAPGVQHSTFSQTATQQHDLSQQSMTPGVQHRRNQVMGSGPIDGNVQGHGTVSSSSSFSREISGSAPGSFGGSITVSNQHFVDPSSQQSVAAAHNLLSSVQESGSFGGQFGQGTFGQGATGVSHAGSDQRSTSAGTFSHGGTAGQLAGVNMHSSNSLSGSKIRQLLRGRFETQGSTFNPTETHPALLKDYIYNKTRYSEPCTSININEGRTHFSVRYDANKFIQCDIDGRVHLQSCNINHTFDVISSTCVDGPLHLDNQVKGSMGMH